MSFVSSFEMIKKAQKEGYAVPAFNAENLEMIQAIVEASVEMESPVIIQTTPSTVKYITLEEACCMVSTLANQVNIPVALHLDHCEKFDDIMKALRVGYTSVMIDGSKLSFEENIAISKKIVEVAKPMGVTVEAELGQLSGKEDGLVNLNGAYTDPNKAKEFVESTGVDIFAVAIGTAHGFYKGEPKLDFERLRVIQDMTDTPLVLHGGSGVPNETIKEAIRLGMSKVNFATELRDAATKAVREVLKDEAVIDPKQYMGKAREAVKQLCIDKIKVCGSQNKS
ncbi:MAG: Tagatose 1,6-bisphosphate aldolase [Clostridia bacterium]|jgi:fructose-1,6-bisphosphate aldolase class II|nr:Tagatose 1,6-bisphosphate aldolase [Clostridia bacterium]